MVKRLQEDQRINEEMSSILNKPTKIHKVQGLEPNSISTPELDESQQVFYDFLESIEMMEDGPSSVNNKEASPTNSIKKGELPTTMDCEEKGIPTNTGDEKGEYSIQNKDLVTLSTLIITSQLKKKKEHVMRLKSVVQKLQVLERFIKTENESLRVHSVRIMEENDNLKGENEQLKKENILLEKQAYKWFKQKKKLRLQNQSLQVKVLMHKPRDQRIKFNSGNQQFCQNFEARYFQLVVISSTKNHFLTSKHILFCCGTYTSILDMNLL